MAINSSDDAGAGFSLKALAQSVNRPSITLAAIVIALALGAMRLPFLQYLRPVGDFYIALLKICVLPFLLSTIPLAVRSAMVGGSAAGTLRSLIVWLVITLVGVAVASVIVTSVILSFASVDERMIANIGALIGQSSDSIDVEFAMTSHRPLANIAASETGIFSVIPTNIFAALSANDSVRVLCFALIFGVGMVMTERQSGYSIFGALRHVQAVCITIFDWFSLLVPIGIVALIAPQVALLGPDAFTVLALFGYAFVGTSLLLLAVAILIAASSLRAPVSTVFAALFETNDARRIDAQHVGLHSDRAGNPQRRSQSQTATLRFVHSARIRHCPLWHHPLFYRGDAVHRHINGPPVQRFRSRHGGRFLYRGLIRDTRTQRHRSPVAACGRAQALRSLVRSGRPADDRCRSNRGIVSCDAQRHYQLHGLDDR
jgi:hypothetical protein